MFRTALVAIVATLTLTVSSAQAERLKIGAAAPTFSGLEGADGKSYSFADMKNKDVVVICITCNHCPFAVAVEDRLVEFTKKFAGPDSKVGFIAINVNNSEADKLPKMKDRAKEKGFNFPYAYDPSQQIAKALGATVTPEFFVFNKDRKLVYTGVMDDGDRKGENIKEKYLELAVAAALKGEAPAKTETAPKGCGVQYDKK